MFICKLIKGKQPVFLNNSVVTDMCSSQIDGTLLKIATQTLVVQEAMFGNGSLRTVVSQSKILSLRAKHPKVSACSTQSLPMHRKICSSLRCSQEQKHLESRYLHLFSSLTNPKCIEQTECSMNIFLMNYQINVLINFLNSLTTWYESKDLASEVLDRWPWVTHLLVSLVSSTVKWDNSYEMRLQGIVYVKVHCKH